MTEAERPRLNLTEYFRPAHEIGFLGTGVRVGVLDTGGSAENYTWAEDALKQALEYAGVPVPWGRIVRLWQETSVASAELDHGARVLTRIQAGAPAAEIYDARVFKPGCTDTELHEAMSLMRQEDVDVLNLSIGKRLRGCEAQAHLQTCTVCALATALVKDHDIVVVAASGNWAGDFAACPALAAGVIKVFSSLTGEEVLYYEAHPDEELAALLEGRAGTSFACAMGSAQQAMNRSAFPGVSAWTWAVFGGANSRLGWQDPDPARQLKELREILGPALTCADWKDLSQYGICTRRQLVTEVRAARRTGRSFQIPLLAKVLAQHTGRLELFTRALTLVADARDEIRSLGVSGAGASADRLQEAATTFRTLGLRLREAAALGEFGAWLVNRAWGFIKGRIVLADAQEAHRVLSHVLELVGESNDLLARVVRATTLSWRARARVLLAEIDPTVTKLAIEDGRTSVQLLSALVTELGGLAEAEESSSRPTVGPKEGLLGDLAHAHVHLARAHFFRAWAEQPPLASDLDAVRHNAETARALARQDPYTQGEAMWMLEHLPGL